jgi:flagellar hook-associated protein 1 FlgK
VLFRSSGLPFYDKLETQGHFKIYVYDAQGNATAHRIETTSTMSLNELAAAINQIDNMNATVTNGQITISADSNYSFNFGEITTYNETTQTNQTNTNLLAVLGINTFWEGEGAGGIKVNDVVDGDHAKIAAGFIAGVEEDDVPPVNGKVGEYEAGDNRNALALALLRSTQVSLTKTNYTLSGGATTQTVSLSLGEFLGDIVSTIGAKVDDAQTNGDFHDMLGSQLDTLIKNYSGVNLDEELLDLLKYQRAYQAAARIITTADEFLQTLMQI